jgi:hypothetical protein
MNQMQSRMEPDPGRYPSADEIPDVMADQAKEKMGGQPKGEMNPIMDSLRVLQQYVATAEQRGDPNAGALKEHLIEFVRTMATGGTQGEGEPAPEGAEKPPMKPEGEMPEEQPEEVPQEAPEGEMPQGEEGPGMPPAMQKKRKLNQRVGQTIPMA